MARHSFSAEVASKVRGKRNASLNKIQFLYSLKMILETQGGQVALNETLSIRGSGDTSHYSRDYNLISESNQELARKLGKQIATH
jgi:hypothetical protein